MKSNPPDVPFSDTGNRLIIKDLINNWQQAGSYLKLKELHNYDFTALYRLLQPVASCTILIHADMYCRVSKSDR